MTPVSTSIASSKSPSSGGPDPALSGAGEGVRPCARAASLWQEVGGRERAFVLVALAGSLMIRFALLGFVSGDMRGDMIPWAEFIESHGGFSALGTGFSNYPPLYLYLLFLATCLPLPKLYAIKAVYLVFDYVAAWYVAGIVRERFGPGLRPWAALLTVLYLPTVVMNSALWGQCDAMYAAGLMACVAYLLRREHWKAFVAFAFAFSFKPQAVFLTPLLVALALERRFSPWLFYIVPGLYILLAIPAWLVGRSLMDLVFLYADQKILPFPSLTLGATNLYQWLSDEHFDLFFRLGLGLAAVCALALVWMLRRRFGAGLSDARLVQASLVSLVLMPYVLPAMHERYFFAADVLAVAYVFWFPRYWPVAVLVQVASFFTYLPYLFDKEPIPRPLLAVVMGVALVLAIRNLFRSPGTTMAEDRNPGGRGGPALPATSPQ